MARSKIQWKLGDSITKLDTVVTDEYNPFDKEELHETYRALAAIMSDEHRAHIEEILNSGKAVDPLLELEMIFRVVQIYSLKAVHWALSQGVVTKDIGALLSEARQSATAIENMKSKREQNKKVDDDDVLNPQARKSALAFLEDIHR